MAGNVWEWAEGSDGRPWLRGGCWSSSAQECQVTARARLTGRERSSHRVGFRVCRGIG